MRELIVASCNGKQFLKNEKVAAYNICEKNYPFNSATYIEKLTPDKILEDGSSTKRIKCYFCICSGSYAGSCKINIRTINDNSRRRCCTNTNSISSFC